MLRSTVGRVAAVGVTLACAACGGSSHDDHNDDVPKAGAPGGQAGSGMSGGRGGVGTGGTLAGGRGGSAGSAAGSGAGGASAGSHAGGSAAGAGQGGAAASSGGGGRGGASGTSGSSGDAGSSAEGGEGGALQDLEDTVASACSAAATCCTAQGFTPMLGDCEALYSMNQAAVPGIKAGHITLDPEALARCKAAYGSGPDQCNLNAVLAACQGVFVGQQGEGEPCIGVYDCDRSAGAVACFITDTSGEQPLGTCQAVPHGQLNDTCFSTCEIDQDCSSSAQGFQTPEELTLCFEEEGLYCDRTESEAKCRPLEPLGQPCEAVAFEACGSQAVCDVTCQARSDRGESCGSCLRQFQCVEGECKDPLWATESTCSGYPPGP